MREGIGSIALYNIIILFIAVTFAILSGTMSYSKAFKVNNRIISSLEKYEGYNEFSSAEIEDNLLSMGYRRGGSKKCSTRSEAYDGSYINVSALESLNDMYNFCVYEIPVETREWNGRYTIYGVKTFIDIDVPLMSGMFRIPVYGKSNKVFHFNNEYEPIFNNNEILNAEFDARYYCNYSDGIPETEDGYMLTFVVGDAVQPVDFINHLYITNGIDIVFDSISSGSYTVSGFTTANQTARDTLTIDYYGAKLVAPYRVLYAHQREACK